MNYWHPTHCTLHLNFVSSGAANEGSSSPLSCGDVYSGTSVIRYVRRPFLSPATVEGLLVSEMHVANREALHFHAITAPTHSFSQAHPLVLRSIKVQEHQAQSSSRFLKVLSVVDDDVSNKGDGKTGKRRESALTANKECRKTVKGKSGFGKQRQDGEERISADEIQQNADVGSKHVFFEGGADMPVGSIVVLTVAFTGMIQEWSQGGIYTSGASKTTAASSTGAAEAASTHGVLLTHFEVALARLAFPCPDDPQLYRLIWHLQSLQLPQRYTTVVSNSVKMAEKKMGNKGAQYSFFPVGPLPAYVLAFAAFCCQVNVVEETLQLRDFSTTGTEKREWCHDATERLVPLRVVASAIGGVTSETLQQIAGIVQEAVPLLEDFFASPLPLQRLAPFDNFEWHEELLTVVVVPTLPYISGMEHHGCIFLSEKVYQSSTCIGNGTKGFIKNYATEANATDETGRVELIIHELAHHWMGNALGMPFALKEGVCLLLEQCFGDIILGRPMRKINVWGNNTIASSFLPTTGAAAMSSVVVVQTEKGKEFTGHSYQKALNMLRDVVGRIGFAVFKERMQLMYKTEVSDRGVIQIKEYNDMGETEGFFLPPYVTADKFLKYMNV